MSPLSAISPLLAGYNITPAVDPATRGLATPALDTPLPLGAPAELGQAQPGNESFSNVLGRLVDEVNTRQAAASDAVSALQSGQNVSLHQAVIAMEEANVSFQLMVEVRNRLLESYQELMRLQI